MKSVLGVAAIASVISFELLGAAPGAGVVRAGASATQARAVQLRLQPQVVDYGPARVSVSGISAGSVSVRLRGATDPAGLAYEWSPYPWRQLRLAQGRWRGVLPAPPLRGIYQLQFRVRRREHFLQSPHWLLRVLSPGTLSRSAFPTPLGVIRDYVSHLPGKEVLVAARPWPPAPFDHRDPRLHRIFVIAYAPQGDNRVSARLGLFITTIRNGYHGRWRLLEAAAGPYD